MRALGTNIDFPDTSLGGRKIPNQGFCDYCNMVIAPAEKTVRGYHKRSFVGMDCADYAAMAIRAKVEMLNLLSVFKKRIPKNLLNAIKTISNFEQAKELALNVTTLLGEIAKREKNFFKRFAQMVRERLSRIWKILKISTSVAIRVSP
ncbi:hypothetical protein HZC33_00130 [Candidatus Wolfebacteria bacterium]|nr:hypothetical protein [Candidatus Wolfebacteria bacterium]